MKRIAVLVVLLAVCGASASAQQMPDPSLIHGRAIPAPELANGTVTVRVVRESIGNDIADQTVTVKAGSATQTAKTDAAGRAEFRGLPQGGQATAEVTVDGEALVSQPFAVPASGGIRVILVAGIAKAAERRKAESDAALAAPPTRGVVVFGENSRVVMQFEGDSLQVYYLLDIVNNARNRVDTGGPLVVDLPTAAIGATVLQGSSPTASIRGTRLIVENPFAPGTTSVQVGFTLPYFSSTLTLEQTWPIALPAVTVGVEKTPGLTLSSPQFTNTRELQGESGSPFLVGNGGALPAGGTLAVTLDNLPFHSVVPRYIALGLAGIVIAVGAWLSISGGARTRRAREALVQRREELLNQLAQLESGRRGGSVAADRYATRRQRILAELEQIYGELDDSSAGPRGGGEGVAA